MSEIDIIIKHIEEVNPVHAKKIKKNFKNQDQEYLDKANSFFKDYVSFAHDCGKDLEFGINSYLRFISDITQEYLFLLKTGKYSSKSFEEVNKKVYNNPEVMEYCIHGLLLSQYLWVHHNDIFIFFKKNLVNYLNKVESYLEVGAGHGLYISEAIDALKKGVNFDIVDLSPTSIDLAKKFIKNNKVNYILSDIFDYKPQKKYDFITMGEVLEHVENPIALMEGVKSLLNEDGCLFMTTPANAPSIDHIYLFNNADEIREIIELSGFEIINEYAEYVEDVSKEIAEKHKITLMYGAFLKIKK